MRILVTGGTGFIGRRLVNKLLKKGHHVIVLDRNIRNARKIFKDSVELIEADILDQHSLAPLKRKRIDVIYHLAAILDETSPEMWRVNVEGTKNLLETLKNKKLERFIYLSSLGVLGETKEPAKEDAPYNPETKYEESKAEAERMITYYWLKHGIPYTIIRATIVYGPNETWAQIIKAAKEGYPIIGSGENLFHLVYVDDVVDALVLALAPIARNKIYHIAGPDVLTYKDTYKLICKLLGVKFTDKRIAKPLALALSKLYEGISKIKSEKPKVTMLSSSIKRLTRNRVADTTLARKELGWKPKYSLERGMKKTISELTKRGLI